MKKLLKTLGILLPSLLVLAACGNGGGSGSSGDTASGEPVEIEYWHGNADTQGGQAVTQLVEEFNASQDEVVVTPVYNENLYVGIMQNLQTAAAAGESPALVQIGWTYREYFANNYDYIDPATLVETTGAEEDVNYLDSKFPTEMLDLARNYQGDLLGFPYSVSTAVIYVNNDLLEEASVDPASIQSYEDLYAASQTINEATGKHGLYITESNDNWSTQYLVESNGAETINAEGQAAFADEGGIQAVQDWADGIEAGHVMHGATDQGHQSFISGDVGMVLTTIAQRANFESNTNFNLSAIEVPAYEGQERAVPAGGALLAVTAVEEEQQEAAFKFIKYLYEPDNIAIWTEGTGYLPPTTDATENQALADLIENDQMFQTSYAQIDDLKPFAAFPGNNGLQATEVYRDYRDRVLNGSPASEEFPAAQDEINELLGN